MILLKVLGDVAAPPAVFVPVPDESVPPTVVEVLVVDGIIVSVSGV